MNQSSLQCRKHLRVDIELLPVFGHLGDRESIVKPARKGRFFRLFAIPPKKSYNLFTMKEITGK
jgi:hypothetical protein